VSPSPENPELQTQLSELTLHWAQVIPSPVKPVSHVHENDPTELLQSALASQLSTSATHSSASLHVGAASPVYPALHTH
jgi:hypothetical protein